MSNFWNQEEEFRDMPDEVEEGQVAPEPLLPPSPQRPAQQRPAPKTQPEPEVETYEDLSISPMAISDQDIDDLEEDYSAVLNDARLRLEQGRLYEMVMNNDLFQDLDADPKAIRFVQKEIRKFAKERMEIMLGMRQEQQRISGPVEVELPFNQLEITILKKLASAATKGATEKVDKQATAVAAPAVAPKKDALTPIGTKKKPAAAPVKEAPKQTLPSKPAKPIARPKVEPVVETQEDPDADYVPINKPLSELTDQEFEERAKQTQARLAKQRKAQAKNVVPQLTYEQEEMLHMTRAANAAPAVSAIMTILNSQKK
jgi:hypothetical protein